MGERACNILRTYCSTLRQETGELAKYCGLLFQRWNMQWESLQHVVDYYFNVEIKNERASKYCGCLFQGRNMNPRYFASLLFQRWNTSLQYFAPPSPACGRSPDGRQGVVRPIFQLRISKFGVWVKQTLKRRRWTFFSAPFNFLAQSFRNVDSKILGPTILSVKNDRTGVLDSDLVC